MLESTTQDHDAQAREIARRQEFTNGLRDIADFIEQNPDLPIPNDVDVSVHFWTREDFVAAARALGTSRKDYSRQYAEVWRQFGPHKIRFQALREQVCTKVVTATRNVEVEEPDPDAVAALPKVKRTKVEEVVEWKCEPLLAETPA